jgi:hypothetical protein
MTKATAVPYKNLKLRIVGPLQDFYASRVQRLDFPTTLPSTTINELGNSRHAGIITDIPECTATFQAFDVSHKIYAIMTGVNPNAFGTGAWDSDTGKGEGGVDVKNLGHVDMIGYIRDADVAQIVKCIHAKYMMVTDFTFTYSVDAESTEEYTVAGSEKRYFKNDVIVNSGNLVTGVATLSQTPKPLKSGDKLLSLIVNGVWKTETTDYTVTGQTVTCGATNNPYLAIYHASGVTLPFTYISDSTQPVAIRGKNVEIDIMDAASAWQKMYRVQSVSIRGTFPNTKVMEMGNIAVVGYIVDPPDVTGDINVLDTDSEIVALLSTGYIAGGAGGTDKEFRVSDYETQDLSLKVVIKDPADNTTVKKTVYIPTIRITSDGTSTNVGAQLTQTFAYSSEDAQCIVYSGSISVVTP